jgi:hypothetical protein
MWKTDKDGKVINIPDVGYDHFNDAVRYGMETLVRQPEEYYQVTNLTPYHLDG